VSRKKPPLGKEGAGKLEEIRVVLAEDRCAVGGRELRGHALEDRGHFYRAAARSGRLLMDFMWQKCAALLLRTNQGLLGSRCLLLFVAADGLRDQGGGRRDEGGRLHHLLVRGSGRWSPRLFLGATAPSAATAAMSIAAALLERGLGGRFGLVLRGGSHLFFHGDRLDGGRLASGGTHRRIAAASDLDVFLMHGRFEDHARLFHFEHFVIARRDKKCLRLFYGAVEERTSKRYYFERIDMIRVGAT
jgi:hypothetical protein